MKIVNLVHIFDFCGIAIVKLLLHISDIDSTSLTLKDIESWLLTLKFRDSCLLLSTLVTLKFASHESLLIQPHLL